MQTLKIYGASDDLVEVEGLKQWPHGAEEFPVNRRDRGTFVLGGKLFIRVTYGKLASTWSIEVTPVMEDMKLPWDIKMYLDERYGLTLEVSNLEDDVTLIQTHDEEE